ncbi:phosphate/phosphite/phosphonate ABC transporter substrate-binding protein [Azonexus sp.]|uniref:phosphate/phosphite/phosphonate ABC transporter substrate-binding protein n=1 Tax=Azonexus sp. TaxID=1872668 RepID=UPI0039E3178E
MSRSPRIPFAHMQGRLWRGLCCAFAIGLLLSCSQKESALPNLDYHTAPTTSETIYRFAVHPLHNPGKLASAYQPLIEHLNQRIPGAHFVLEASRDYAAFEAKLRAKEPEFLLPNPWQTLEAIKAGYQVIAMAGDAADFHGIFIVRRDSPLKQPADLRGQAVSYPSPTALAAAMLPQQFLHAHGLDVQRDIDNRYVGSQESSIMNAYLGQSAAAATWPPPWRLFQQDHPEEAAQLKIIWQTPSLVNNSVMARRDLPAQLIAAVRQELLALSPEGEGENILNAMATARFHPAEDRDYTVVSDFVARFEREVRPVEIP